MEGRNAGRRRGRDGDDVPGSELIRRDEAPKPVPVPA